MADNIRRFHPPPGLIPVHWCFGKRLTIDNCRRSWPDDDIHKACEFGGQSYVFVTCDTGSQTYTDNYKNYFCPICNYEDVSSLQCLYRPADIKCTDPVVYSMQKLFSVVKCRSLETLAIDEVKPFFLMKMVLNINDVIDLPQDRVSFLITKAEVENLGFKFYIGDCYRRWDQGLDYIQIGGKKGSNSTQSFIYDVRNITEVWEYIHKYNSHGSSLIISFLNSKCVHEP